MGAQGAVGARGDGVGQVVEVPKGGEVVQEGDVEQAGQVWMKGEEVPMEAGAAVAGCLRLQSPDVLLAPLGALDD